MEKKLIIFTDCGDTLVDESTEVRDESGAVIDSKLIDGAKESLLQLYEEGHRIALVADGTVASFRNIIRQHGIDHVFETLAISEAVGCEKPDPRMFRTAMDNMGLTAEDASRIVMIGNNIKRDVAGANRLGICSILLSFSVRYSMYPLTEDWVPDYVVAMPDELPELIGLLERQLHNREILQRKPIPAYPYKDYSEAQMSK